MTAHSGEASARAAEARAWRAEGGRVPKLGSDQLPHRVTRQAVDEGHVGRDLVGSQMLSAPGKELLFGRIGPGRHDNEGGRYLFTAGF